MNPGGDDHGAILVLKVWREPGFRARITVNDPESDQQARMALATNEDAVVDYVRDWLVATPIGEAPVSLPCLHHTDGCTVVTGP